jgi:aryl-alcohol dehydrogenase-like predicted oxidoreductase
MKYHQLGKSGLFVSALGLGTNSFGGRADESTSAKILETAIANGINFIDTANTYTNSESERIIGSVLENGKRHQVLLATKVGMKHGNGDNEGGSSRREIMEQVEGSLRRLQTDYIDLYQIHTIDKRTPLDETLRALDDLVTQGKVRYIGASNFLAWELMKALAISERHSFVKFVSVQPCYSLADRTIEQELEPFCLEEGIGVIPFFPLAGGILTGKYAGGQIPGGSRAEKESRFQGRIDSARLALGDDVAKLAADLGETPSAVSLAWLMQRPSVSTVIVGASRVEQVEENLQSVEIELDKDARAKLDELSEKFRYSQPFGVFRPYA